MEHLLEAPVCQTQFEAPTEPVSGPGPVAEGVCADSASHGVSNAFLRAHLERRPAETSERPSIDDAIATLSWAEVLHWFG